MKKNKLKILSSRLTKNGVKTKVPLAETLVMDADRRCHGLRGGGVGLPEDHGSTPCPSAVTDTVASKSGVYYTSANGGTISNDGQQTVPVCFENRIKTYAVFQVAEVSRPLMSVAKICELGNRVLFGAGGGVIVNLASGQSTPFYKKDGVYVFSMWVPPLSESPFGRPH